MICSVISLSILLLYVSITLKDFIERPPQLVKHGSVALNAFTGEASPPPPIAIEISYSIQDRVSGNWTYTNVDYTNKDPYFRYKFASKTINSADNFQRTITLVPGVECSWNAATMKNIICPDEEMRKDLTLEGSYNLPFLLYRYFEVEVERCSGTGCAPSEEIDALIEHGNVSVVLYTKEEDFDAMMYHHNSNSNPKRGVYENVQNWKFYPLPNREQLTEISMEIRSIKVEARYFGPLQTSNTEIMTVHSVNSTHKSGGRSKIMNFYFKLHNRTSKEQVEYGIQSILHLVSSWGAMASLVTIFSIGIISRWYNERTFRLNLEKANRISKDNFRQPGSDLFTDIRFLHKEDFDEKGQFKLSLEELYFPSNCYGELRAIALVEHQRKRNAANKIGKWYTHHLYRRKCKQAEKPRSIMKKKSRLNLHAVTKTTPTVYSSANTPTTYQDSSSGLLSVHAGEQQSHASQSTISFPVGIGENESISEFSAKKTKDSPSVSTSGGYTIISQTPYNINSIKEGIAENSKILIQKAKHNRQLKPWTELTENLTQNAVVSLFQPLLPSLDSSRVMKWKLNGDEVIQWLGLSENHIHPVAFEGKVICEHGQRPSVYAWAKYETCEAKFDKKSRILTLRFQTFLFGTGLPDESGSPQFTYEY